MTQLPAIDDGLGIIVRSMVREGRLVAVLTRREAARRAPFSADLVVNGVTRSSAECPAGADEVTLSAPVPADDVVLSSLAVEVAVDGARSVVPASAEHALPRLVMRDMEDFRATVMRKQYRIGDPETLLEAARTAARRFPDDITIQAVSLSVIGYRYIETPALASRKEVLEFARRADRLRARLDDTDPDDARWSPSIDVMLYQLFAVRLDHPRAALPSVYAAGAAAPVSPAPGARGLKRAKRAGGSCSRRFASGSTSAQCRAPARKRRICRCAPASPVRSACAATLRSFSSRRASSSGALSDSARWTWAMPTSEYMALLLMKANSRIVPTRFGCSVAAVTKMSSQARHTSAASPARPVMK